MDKRSTAKEVSMEPRVVVIGGSAGAIPILQHIIPTLSMDIRAALFVVVHMAPDSPGFLADVLGRAGGPPVTKAQDGKQFELANVYVAVPDHHLQIADGQMRLVHGPRENRSRPSIDPLFRTAARWYGKRVIAVLLSGLLDDGVAGLQAVKRAGGQVIVLDPSDTRFPQMPQNGIRYDHPDYVLGCDEIGPAIERLVREPIMNLDRDPNEPKREGQQKPSGYMCPDCGGCLFQTDESGGPPKFECWVGHAYSIKALLAAGSDALESALWAAVRSLEENAALKRNAASSLFEENQYSRRLREDAASQEEHAKVLRSHILGVLTPSREP